MTFNKTQFQPFNKTLPDDIDDKEHKCTIFLFIIGCGFLYKEQDIKIATTIIKDSCHIESLPQLTYGYTSNIKVSVTQNIYQKQKYASYLEKTLNYFR